MSGKISYKDYIRSPEWRYKKNEKLIQVQWKCERCGNDDIMARLDVHHKTYERLGDEWMSDLEVLCYTCHKIVHGRVF